MNFFLPGFDDDDELDLEDPEFGESLEIRFVPEDNGTLDAIFSAMKHCQSLNPDYAGDSGDLPYRILLVWDPCKPMNMIRSVVIVQVGANR